VRLHAVAPAFALALAPLALSAAGAELGPGLGVPSAAADVHGVPPPRGSRAADPARPDAPALVSGRGFRDSVEHVRRFLRRRGLAHQEVPVYRRGGITVARFLSRHAGTPWLAIHVFQTGGRTYFTVVPRPPSGS